jgi:tryptophan synthase beta subunit
MKPEQCIIVNLSGRGDKDVQTVADMEQTRREAAS